MESARPGRLIHMLLHHKLGDGRSLINETKLAIVAEMQRVGHPVTSEEMHAVLGEAKPLAAIEYHLSTLVSAGFAKALFGPDIYFQLVTQGGMPAGSAS